MQQRAARVTTDGFTVRMAVAGRTASPSGRTRVRTEARKRGKPISSAKMGTKKPVVLVGKGHPKEALCVRTGFSMDRDPRSIGHKGA